MKIKYFLMGAALVAMSAGFTACSDDDDEPAPVVDPVETPDMTLPEDAQRVKIGKETRLPLSEVVLEGNGSYNAISLNPEVAGIETDDDGKVYIAGYKNGMASIVISDAAGAYKRLVVAVYTTDVMKLNYTKLNMTTILNNTNTVEGVGVAEGNGNYEVVSDNTDIQVYVNKETGAVTVRAASKEAPYSGNVTVTDQTGLKASLVVNVSKATHRVKIGTDTRVAVPTEGTGDYTAESLTPNIAKIYEDASGKKYVEGLANGVAFINVMQGETFSQYTFNVYTTDVMQLTHTAINMVTPLGISAQNAEISVVKGNGNYSVRSDNNNVQARINATSGQVTLTATSRKDPFTANITVSDVSGLTATVKVTVSATFDAFVQSDFDNILAKTKHSIDFNGSYPWYFRYLDYGSYGEMKMTTTDGTTRLGYNYTYDSWWSGNTEYYTLEIDYPSNLAVGQEASGHMYFADGEEAVKTYNGTVKLLADDDTRTVVAWWNVDMQNERIDRGYIVYMK